MIDILLGAIVFLLAQVYKKIDTKYGDEISKNVLLVLAFCFSVILAGFYSLYNGTINASNPQALIGTALDIFKNSIVLYEVIYKRIVLPILKFTKNKI